MTDYGVTTLGRLMKNGAPVKVSSANLRAPPWDCVMVVIMIIQRPLAGNVLRLACYVTFNACFYFYYCILNLVAYISSHSNRCK